MFTRLLAWNHCYVGTFKKITVIVMMVLPVTEWKTWYFKQNEFSLFNSLLFYKTNQTIAYKLKFTDKMHFYLNLRNTKFIEWHVPCCAFLGVASTNNQACIYNWTVFPICWLFTWCEDIQWTLCKASLQEVTHVCVDVLIGRAAESMVLVRVPLIDNKKKKSII